MIKLIASDMDGTLLDSNKNINPEFNKILNTLKEKGIIFAAISGRDLASLKYAFKDVKEDIVFASNNGNFIVYKGKVLFENYTPSRSAPLSPSAKSVCPASPA